MSLHPDHPPKPRIVAIANQKGGVGKTTTAINLATALAAARKRVLVFDLDPQGNASTGLGLDRTARSINAYHVLVEGQPVGDALRPSDIPGLDLVPAGMDLSAAEMELAGEEDSRFILRGMLRDAALDYDYVLIDCPPALGLLTVNALVAAHSVLVPLQCEFFALEGISQLMDTIARVRHSLNPALDIQGILLTMFDKRNNLSDLVANDVRRHFGDAVYRTVIPRNVRVSEAPSHGQPVLIYDHGCAGSQAYISLASEFIMGEPKAAA